MLRQLPGTVILAAAALVTIRYRAKNHHCVLPISRLQANGVDGIEKNSCSVTRDLAVSDGNRLPFTDPLQERQEQGLKPPIRHAARRPHARAEQGFAEGILPAQWPGTRPRTLDLCAAGRNRPREAEPSSNGCAVSDAVRVAVLCCCTIGPDCSNFASELWS